MRFTLIALAALSAATPALAHTGAHSVSGFAAGFLHPLGGLDHVLAMIGIGLFAALLGRGALFAVPGSFVLMMLVGGIIGMTGWNIPAVEAAIAASVVVVGAVVALGWSFPMSAAAVLAGFLALFHGYAHGVELPFGASALPYSAGFMGASAALHILGIIMSRIALGRREVTRPVGIAITLAGAMLAFG